MFIEHFLGKTNVKDKSEIDQILRLKADNGSNEFVITFDECEFPWIIVSTLNDYAHVHYFPEKDHPGFQAIGTLAEEIGEDFMVFYTNTPTEEISVESEYVVDIETAVNIVRALYERKELPDLVEWDEL